MIKRKKIILALILAAAIVIVCAIIFYPALAQQFFNKYFIEPVVKDIYETNTGEGEYNIFNTLVYGAILVLALFLIYKLVKKLNFKLGKEFFIAILPFIVLGSVLRVLEDTKYFKPPFAYLLVSPIIYIFLGAIVVGIVVLTQLLSKKFTNTVLLVTGCSLVICSLSLCFLTPWRHWEALGSILALSALATAIVMLGFKLGSFKLSALKICLSHSNLALFYAHFLDASATFVGVDFYGYGEKHPLPTIMINIFGSAWIICLLKFIVVFFVIYLLRIRYKNFLDENAKLLVIFCVFVLGLAPGIRDMLRIGIGV
ncbi:MAG: DUF63 family protein [Candidatus Thermoplasmatota archaeon]